MFYESTGLPRRFAPRNDIWRLTTTLDFWKRQNAGDVMFDMLMKNTLRNSLILACSAFAVLVLAGCGIFSSDDFPGPPPGAGDIDLNGVPFEQADYDLFLAYLRGKLDTLPNANVSESIARTDVNGDGVTLSIADLVYFGSVRRGNAIPPEQLDNSSVLIPISRGLDTYSASVPLGGALFRMLGGRDFDRDTLINGLQYHITESSARRESIVIVLPLDGKPIPAKSSLYAIGHLVSMEAATSEGIVLHPLVSLIPPAVVLIGNAPNPFYPYTRISFAVTIRSKYTLAIHNSRGSLVRLISGEAGGEMVTIGWDARDFPTGTYFYRVRVGDESVSGKMILQR